MTQAFRWQTVMCFSAASAVLVVLLAQTASAQSPGAFRGVIEDETRAVLQGATIELRGPVTAMAISDRSGGF